MQENDIMNKSDLSLNVLRVAASNAGMVLVQINPPIAANPKPKTRNKPANLYTLSAGGQWICVRRMTKAEIEQTEQQARSGIVLNGLESEFEFKPIRAGWLWRIARFDQSGHVQPLFGLGVFWRWVRAARIAADMNSMFQTGKSLGRNYSEWDIEDH